MMFTVPVSFSDGPYGVRPMASEGEEGGVCLREALEIVDVQLRSHCAQKPYLSNPSPCLAMRWANSDATHFRLGLFRD